VIICEYKILPKSVPTFNIVTIFKNVLTTVYKYSEYIKICLDILIYYCENIIMIISNYVNHDKITNNAFSMIV